MSLRARSLRAAAVLAAALAAAPAAAWVQSTDRTTGKGLFWAVPVVPYHVSDAQPSARSPGCAAGPAGDPVLAAATAGFSEWSRSCADLDLVFAGAIPEVRTGIGGAHENLVVFRMGWCTANPAAAACIAAGGADCANQYNCFDDAAPMDRNVIALTSALYEPATGRILAADIEVNGWDGRGTSPPAPLSGTAGPEYGWYFTCEDPAGRPMCTTYGQAGCYYVDLRNTITHEAGHFIGLAHPCTTDPVAEPYLPLCNASYSSTTMYPVTSPGDVAKRTLSPDDVAGLCAIYPAGGGCGCGTGGAPGALAALLAIAALRPRRSGRRDQATSSAA